MLKNYVFNDMCKEKEFNLEYLEVLYDEKGIPREDSKIVEVNFLRMFHVARSKYCIESKPSTLSNQLCLCNFQ